MGYRGELIFLPRGLVSQPIQAYMVALRHYSQMDGNSSGPEVIDSKNAADHVAAHVIEHQDLPYWLAIFVDDSGRLRYGAVLRLFFCRVSVEVEDVFDRRYSLVSLESAVPSEYPAIPIWRSLNESAVAAMMS